MEKFIDVEQIIADKNKSLLGWLPTFFIRWIKEILHEDEVNEFLSKNQHCDTHAFCRKVIEEFRLTLHIEGMENVPPVGESCVFAANHPLGGLDAIAILHLLRHKRPDIKFIVNDVLMNLKMLEGNFTGVNKVGRNASESLRKVEALFASDGAVFVFPAGLVSRKTNGVIRDLDWKKTFISKSRKYRKPIVPVYIDGRLTNRFYRLANIRKFLGIKLNIEMFFLVDELFRQKNMHIDIIIGAPILPDTLTKEKTDVEWAQWVKDKMYGLKKA